MRCEEEDPLYQVTFRGETFTGYETLRLGRPRGHWAATTIKETLWDLDEIEYMMGQVDFPCLCYTVGLWVVS